MKLEVCYLLHKKSKGTKIVKFFKNNLNISCPPIPLNPQLKFIPRGTPHDRCNLTSEGRNFTNKYRRGVKLIKSQLARHQTGYELWARFRLRFGLGLASSLGSYQPTILLKYILSQRINQDMPIKDCPKEFHRKLCIY